MKEEKNIIPIDLIMLGRIQESLDCAVQALYSAHREITSWERSPFLQEGSLIPEDLCKLIDSLLESTREVSMSFDDLVGNYTQKIYELEKQVNDND